MGRMLFIRGGAVGDFLLTLPALDLVRRNLPQVEIEILGYDSIAEVAVAAGLASRVRSIEHAALAPFFAPGATLDAGMCDYFNDFDVVISYLYDPDGFFGDNLTRAGVETLIVGPYRMDESEPYRNAAVQLAQPLEQLALFPDTDHVTISVSSENGSSGGGIAIHPGSGSASKNWSFEGWLELLEKIHATVPGVDLHIVSGEAERDTIEEFHRMLQVAGVAFRPVVGKSLLEVAAILETCDLFLGHDSGISHLAASVGVPGFLLFGPTNPEIWCPAAPTMDYLVAPDRQLGGLQVDNIWNHSAFRDKLTGLLDR